MQENTTIEPVAQEEGAGALVMSLMDFIDNCREGLLDAVSRTIPRSMTARRILAGRP